VIEVQASAEDTPFTADEMACEKQAAALA